MVIGNPLGWKKKDRSFHMKLQFTENSVGFSARNGAYYAYSS